MKGLNRRSTRGRPWASLGHWALSVLTAACVCRCVQGSGRRSCGSPLFAYHRDRPPRMPPRRLGEQAASLLPPVATAVPQWGTISQ